MDHEWFDVSQLDERSAGILDQIVARTHANEQVQYLAQAEHLWPLYITGVVAHAMGLGREELVTKSKLLVEIFTQRLHHGYARTQLARKGVRELLEIADENTIRGPGREHFKETGDTVQPDFDSWTLFRDPASHQDVSDLETRLGVTLQDEYKEFLHISNGFGLSRMNDGIYNG